MTTGTLLGQLYGDAEMAAILSDRSAIAAMLRVEVYGSLKGTLRYGQSIPVVYCPALCDEMTDAATLQSLPYDALDAAAPKKDGICLFFLVNSPDPKQDMYFAVNPIQGFAALDPPLEVIEAHVVDASGRPVGACSVAFARHASSSPPRMPRRESCLRVACNPAWRR